MDLTPILQVFFGLLAALMAACLIPWIRICTRAQRYALSQRTARTFVYAAEQTFGPGRGDEKLEYVRLQLLLRDLDVDIAAIEAAVLELTVRRGEEDGYP